jgi:hypothetical protein
VDDRRKGQITYAVVVGGALLFILATIGGEIFGPMEYFAPSGEVVSVEGPPGEKQALVKLDSGDVVRAEVPAACIVFPGQVALLGNARGRFEPGPKYRILSAKDRNDS